MGISREGAMAHPERALTSEQTQAFARLVERRAGREPLAYLLGSREFYGLPFRVNKHTLIPRPETEGMIDLALAWIDRCGAQPLRFVDVGTGSGAIALTLLCLRAELSAIATDTSLDALAVARANAAHLLVSDRVQFVACDLVD